MAQYSAKRMHQFMVLAMVAATLPLSGCKTPSFLMTRDTPAPVLVAPLRQVREALIGLVLHVRRLELVDKRDDLRHRLPRATDVQTGPRSATKEPGVCTMRL